MFPRNENQAQNDVTSSSYDDVTMTTESKEAGERLLCFVKLGEYEATKQMMEIEDNMEYQDEDGCSGVWHAADRSEIKVLSLFLRKRANLEVCDHKHRNTPLLIACLNNDFYCARELVDYKANFEHVNRDGLSAMCIAASLNNIELMIILRAYGATPDSITVYRTPLLIACEKGHFDAVKYLLAEGARVDLQDPHGNTAMLLACSSGNLDIVRLLDEADDEGVFDQNEDDVTTLMEAAKAGNIELVDYLQSRQVWAEAVDRYGNNALILAASRGKTEMCVHLIENLAMSVTDVNDLTLTPYLCAQFNRHNATAEQLLRYELLELQL